MAASPWGPRRPDRSSRRVSAGSWRVSLCPCCPRRLFIVFPRIEPAARSAYPVPDACCFSFSSFSPPRNTRRRPVAHPSPVARGPLLQRVSLALACLAIRRPPHRQSNSNYLVVLRHHLPALSTNVPMGRASIYSSQAFLSRLGKNGRKVAETQRKGWLGAVGTPPATFYLRIWGTGNSPALAGPGLPT